ncbi:MAG TPA: trehalase-like domain-containing protein, partial [Actinomycetota bacterium]|nr:trehalase-like domain-containing protein [Actinomycetota bacterium]
MALAIEDYGIIGDLRTAALVGNDGSIDWLCVPRFDSAACFAALLGNEQNGTWRIAPAGKVIGTSRRYRPHSLVLETDFETAEGVARVTDCMPLTSTHPRVARVVEGIRGTVAMELFMSPRFDYGDTKPWVHKIGEAVEAGAGPNAVELRGHAPLRAHDFHA